MTDIPLSGDQIAALIITVLSIVSGTSTWQLVKKYVHEGRVLIDHTAAAVDMVDTVIQSPTVTIQDIRNIWTKLKAIPSLNP